METLPRILSLLQVHAQAGYPEVIVTVHMN